MIIPGHIAHHGGRAHVKYAYVVVHFIVLPSRKLVRGENYMYCQTGVFISVLTAMSSRACSATAVHP